MPFVETRFISPTTLTTSAASALYTVPTGYSAIIKQLVVTNITGTAATFTFYVNTASASNALFSGTSVAANDTVIVNLSQVLTTGETLRALASANSALNLTVSGVLNDGPLASTATYIADNAITSAKIADGAIVNADINASAAIDQSKIASLTSDLSAKAPTASPTFTGNATFPNITFDAASGTISSQGVGNFKTIASNGRGVGISGGTGDTAAILQFTNNAVGAQWGSITASSASALAINAYDGTAGSIALNASSITTSTPITGSIVQVIHTIYATNYSRTNTSATPFDVTGWSMSITPRKAGNKIIILTQAALMAICDGYLHLKKNGSLLANPLISVPRVDFSYDDATFFGQYVDTAASTSAITYQFAGAATGCSGVFGVNSQGGVSSTIMIEVQS
jgi:hypothetical protein